jgi:hypothetical protein
MDWKEAVRTHVRKVISQVKELKMNEEDELIDAVKALIVDIESMSCIPDDTSFEPDSGHWYGEFTEYEENDDAEVIIEWPNLAIGVEKIKQILDKLASQ